MKTKFCVFVFLFSAACPSMAARSIGDRLIFNQSSWVPTRVDDERGSRTGFIKSRISGHTAGIIVSARQVAGVDIFTLRIEAEDPERICSATGKVGLLVEAPYDVLEIDYGQTAQHRQLVAQIAELKRAMPQLDWASFDPALHRDDFGNENSRWEQNDGSFRAMLVHTCGDPRKLTEADRLSIDELSQKISPEEEQRISADYPALSELKDMLTRLDVKDSADYASLVDSRKGSERRDLLQRARQQIHAIIETSELEEPRFDLRRKIRRTFFSQAAQQLALEEAAHRFNAAQRSTDPENSCAALVRSLRLLQHVDADVAPLGFESSNSVLLLYAVFHGAYFSNHRCAEAITQAFGRFDGGLPYGLPRIGNPALTSQRSVTHYFLLIPYKTERLNPDEWAADFPSLGRIVMESLPLGSGRSPRYFWKSKNPNEKRRFKDSTELLKNWSARVDEPQ